MARKARVFTASEIAEVKKLGGAVTSKQLSMILMMPERTLMLMFDREPKVHAVYKKARAQTGGKIAKKLIDQAMAGDVTCMIFYLKTQMGWHEDSPSNRLKLFERMADLNDKGVFDEKTIKLIAAEVLGG